MAANMADLFGESEEDDDDDFAPPLAEEGQITQGFASSALSIAAR